jgi:hypothetical protein
MLAINMTKTFGINHMKTNVTLKSASHYLAREKGTKADSNNKMQFEKTNLIVHHVNNSCIPSSNTVISNNRVHSQKASRVASMEGNNGEL